MKKSSSGSVAAILAASALLIGSTVGAGIFALPYVISKSGVGIGLAYLVAIAIVSLFINLAYGEVVLRTEGRHQFPAYVKKYLGERWRIIALVTLFIQFYGALTAYLIEVGNLFYGILGDAIGGRPIHYSIAFFFVMAASIYIGLKAVSGIEQLLVVAIILIIIVFCALAIPHIAIANYTLINLPYALLPYGVVLFAFGGAGAIVDMSELLREHRRLLGKAIVIGTAIPFVLYTSFVLITVGVSGDNTSQSAVVGLGNVLGPIALYAGSIFGILSMATSFLLLGLILREVYQFDLHWRPTTAWLGAIIPPLLLLAFQLFSFIEILGITGAVTGGLTGIMFVKMHHQAKLTGDRVPEFSITQSQLLHSIVMGVFILGIVYEAYIAFTRYLS